MIISTRRAAMALVLLGSSLVGLSACAPVVLGGAYMGTLVATDRRTSGSQLEDEGIELRANSRIRENVGERVHVNTVSYNRRVLLIGEVPTAQDKQLVEKIVQGVDNVREVVNELAVMGNSSFTQRSSDTIVTGKVKANLLDAKDLFANAFKIVTERGTVYVMGRVTEREAKRGTEVISGTSGVQRVVRLLEIISEEELAQCTASSPARAGQEVNKKAPLAGLF
jgi:osmotically-inducible protein OsmY